MTKEEALKILKGGNERECTWPEYCEAYNMAIQALEQEPILDKIRAEVKRLQKMCDKNDLNLMAQYSAFGMVLDIFDKYKAEIESQESEAENGNDD